MNAAVWLGGVFESRTDAQWTDAQFARTDSCSVDRCSVRGGQMLRQLKTSGRTFAQAGGGQMPS
jgi:hypothetical protein